jgi:cobalt/nickel transport system permease protein
MKGKLQSFEIPHVALASAFVFVIMMFNVPLPGGTSGHAVGAGVAAIVLGFSPAVIAVSFALAIQALLFGDGGVTAYGANCLNMAIIEPAVALFMWNLLRPNELGKSSSRTFWAAFAAGYAGIVIAALATAVEFGIQPALEHTATGTPLFSPYPLAVSIPAMVIPHLVVGIIEGGVTGFLVMALIRSPDAARINASGLLPSVNIYRRKTFWLAAAVVILLVPAGLYLPRITGAEGAWGEWNPDEATARAGLSHVPRGMHRLSSLWRAPLPDYSVAANTSSAYESVQYVFAAIAGIIVIAIVFSMLGRWQKARMAVLSNRYHEDAS